MMERGEIVRWAVGELGPASQANVEAVLDKIRQEQEDKKSSKPFTQKQRNSFCATLRSLRAKLRKLPPKFSSGLGEHQLDLEHVPPRLNQGDSRGAKDGRVYRH